MRAAEPLRGREQTASRPHFYKGVAVSEPEKIVEHHYRDPSQSQVNKALYQFLADQGVTVDKLERIVEKKVQEAMERMVSKMLTEDRYMKMFVNTAAQVMLKEKVTYDASTYGWQNKVRDLVQQELQRLVLSEYKVTVEKRA